MVYIELQAESAGVMNADARWICSLDTGMMQPS